MSGWNSLDSVGTLHTLLQISGLVRRRDRDRGRHDRLSFLESLDDLVAIAERARSRYLPRWRADTAMTLHNTFIEVAILGIAAPARVRLRRLAVRPAQDRAWSRRRTPPASPRCATRPIRCAARWPSATRAPPTRWRCASRCARPRCAISPRPPRCAARSSRCKRAAPPRSPDREDRSPPRRRDRDAAPCQRPDRRRATPPRSPNCRQRLHQAESRRVASVESLRWEVKQAESARRGRDRPPGAASCTQTERKLVALQTHRRLSDRRKIRADRRAAAVRRAEGHDRRDRRRRGRQGVRAGLRRGVRGRRLGASRGRLPALGPRSGRRRDHAQRGRRPRRAHQHRRSAR